MIRQAIADWRAGRAQRLSSEELKRKRDKRNRELGIITIDAPDGTTEVWFAPTLARDPNDSFVYGEEGIEDCGCGLRDKCPARGLPPYKGEDNANAD